MRYPLPMKPILKQMFPTLLLLLLQLHSFHTQTPATYPLQDGFVDAHGVLIYYQTLGQGAPLLIVHGGPGASHDYFLPYLLPLARHHKLIFIDERGSGKSEKLEDPSGYTVENMVEDAEAVRQALKLGRISLLGHSYGGVLAQAYALKYQANLTHLILCSTFHSTSKMNEVFRRMLADMTPELRGRILTLEKAGLFGKGKDYEKNRYPNDYMIAAWAEGYFPYLPLPERLHDRGVGGRLFPIPLPEAARRQLRSHRQRQHDRNWRGRKVISHTSTRGGPTPITIPSPTAT